MTDATPSDLPAGSPALDLPAGVEAEAEAAERTPQGGDHIIGMSFDKVSRADEVLLALVHLQQEGEISISDAVVAIKDADGKVRVQQTVDPTPGVSAIRGSFWGMLVGLLFPPAGLLVGGALGAGGAALMAKLVDLGLDDGWVKEVGNWLDPGTSALLLLVSADVRPAVVDELRRYEGTVLYCTFPDAVREELERALADEG
jgi:uncharacterized membrane protein